MAVFTKVCFSGKLDSKGRITVPARIRNKLNLEKGDQISIQLNSKRVIRKQFGSKSEALDFIQSLETVKRFSFDGEILEVVIRE